MSSTVSDRAQIHAVTSLDLEHHIPIGHQRRPLAISKVPVGRGGRTSTARASGHLSKMRCPMQPIGAVARAAGQLQVQILRHGVETAGQIVVRPQIAAKWPKPSLCPNSTHLPRSAPWSPAVRRRRSAGHPRLPAQRRSRTRQRNSQPATSPEPLPQPSHASRNMYRIRYASGTVVPSSIEHICPRQVRLSPTTRGKEGDPCPQLPPPKPGRTCSAWSTR